MGRTTAEKAEQKPNIELALKECREVWASFFNEARAQAEFELAKDEDECS